MSNDYDQDHLEALVENLDARFWTAWEIDFIESVRGRRFSDLSQKQKLKVLDLVDKLNEESA